MNKWGISHVKRGLKVAVCCRVLQCVAGCHRRRQTTRVIWYACCKASQCVAKCCRRWHEMRVSDTPVVECCSVLQCVAMCCRRWHEMRVSDTPVVECCSVLQCVAMCCRVFLTLTKRECRLTRLWLRVAVCCRQWRKRTRRWMTTNGQIPLASIFLKHPYVWHINILADTFDEYGEVFDTSIFQKADEDLVSRVSPSVYVCTNPHVYLYIHIGREREGEMGGGGGHNVFQKADDDGFKSCLFVRECMRMRACVCLCVYIIA